MVKQVGLIFRVLIQVRFSPTEAEVGSYLLVVVTGIGDFGGTVISPTTKKVIHFVRVGLMTRVIPLT